MTSHERSEADTAPPARKENPSRSLLAPKVQPEDPSTGPSGRSLGGGVFLHEGGMRNIKESAFETGGAKFTMVYDELIVTHGFTLLDAFVWSLFHRMEGWEDGCIASQGYISKRAGVGRSTVQRCVQRLIDTGWIISEERYSGETRLPNRYKTMLPANPMIQNEQGGCSQNEAVKRVPIQRVPTEEVEDTTLRMEGGVVGGETHKDLQLHPSNEENSQRLTRAWRLAHKMGAEEDPSAPPMIPQSVSFYEAEVAAKAQGDNLEFFPTDQILASELLRIIRAFKVEGYTVTFKGVTKMIGQPFGETVPVIWPKNAPLPKKKAPPPEKQDFAYPDLTNLREQMMRESEKP